MNVKPQEDCHELLLIFGKVIESGKGILSEPAESALVAEALANKAHLHAASAYWLSKGTRVERLLGPTEAVIFDVASVAVLARACMEAYVTFYYIFREPKNEDARRFRHLAWHYAGVYQRARYEPVSETEDLKEFSHAQREVILKLLEDHKAQHQEDEESKLATLYVNHIARRPVRSATGGAINQ